MTGDTPRLACAVHEFEPVNYMRAVYRCWKCGGFAYKPKIRTGGASKFRTNELTMFRCHVQGCVGRVVVIFPVVKGVKRHQPSCEEHRKDKPKQKGTDSEAA